MKKQLLLILMALLPTIALADESGTCGDNLTWTYYESTHSLVIVGSGDMYNYEEKKMGVEDVCLAPWYKYRNDIVSVTLPDGLTNIGEWAFWRCTSLPRLPIPNSVTSIGSGAFRQCSALTSVTIPNSVTSIGANAFSGCSGLASVIIPNSVTSIDENAFGGCSGLTSVTIPNSVTSINKSVFSECRGLTSVTIPNSVTFIDQDAFSGCIGLNAVHITDLAAWCNISFSDGYYSNPLSYAHHLYLNGDEVKNLVIPNSVTSIGRYTFYGCSGLASVTIPNSVTSIGFRAFMDCCDLTSVIISNGVMSIGCQAFYRCNSLISVNIPNTVTSIEAQAFLECSSLIFMSIPNSVTSIEEQVFKGCSSLTSVTIPNSVTSIDDEAFMNCGSLSTISIPNSVTSIGEQTFSGCSRLRTVSLPDNLIIIKKQTFQNCSNLQKMIIPASVQYIYQQAFSGCNALNEIVAQPETPPFIYNDTFSNYDCTLKVPEAGKDAYLAHEIWKKFYKIQTPSGEDIETPKCATPTISYQNGKLVFSSATEGVTYRSTITDSDISSYTTAEVQLTATYHITVYATKAGYDNSDVVTATLCWIDKEPVIDVTDISQVPAQAVLIQSDGGLLTVQGLDDGTEVSVYGVNGTEASAAVSHNGQAQVNTHLSPGSVAIVKIGEKSVKVVIK